MIPSRIPSFLVLGSEVGTRCKRVQGLGWQKSIVPRPSFTRFASKSCFEGFFIGEYWKFFDL